VDGLASFVTSKTIMTLAQTLFILMGIGLGLALLNRSSEIVLAACVALGMLAFGVVLFLSLQRRGLFVGVLRLLEATGIGVKWLKAREHKLRELDEAISRFYSQDKRGFAWAFVLFFLGWAVESVEVYFILYFLAQPIDALTAFSIAALLVLVKGGMAFIPGSVGGQEAGTLVLLVAFGYSEGVAIAFAIVRRVREIVWIVFGLAALAIENRRVYQAGPVGRPPG
jgi:glycosyltransferase 2 family protein